MKLKLPVGASKSWVSHSSTDSFKWLIRSEWSDSLWMGHWIIGSLSSLKNADAFSRETLSVISTYKAHILHGHITPLLVSENLTLK